MVHIKKKIIKGKKRKSRLFRQGPMLVSNHKSGHRFGNMIVSKAAFYLLLLALLLISCTVLGK